MTGVTGCDGSNHYRPTCAQECLIEATPSQGVTTRHALRFAERIPPEGVIAPNDQYTRESVKAGLVRREKLAPGLYRFFTAA